MAAVPHLIALPRPATKVVLAEDHPQMRWGLRRLLEDTAGVEVAAAADSLAETRQHVRGHRPDVLVLDLDMPDGSSIALIEELHRSSGGPKIVLVTFDDTPGVVRRALAAGADGYVLKERADEELPDAVEAVVRGSSYVSPRVTADVAEARRRRAERRAGAPAGADPRARARPRGPLEVVPQSCG